MSFLTAKFQRLTILGYKEAEKPHTAPVGKFEALFNPESYKLDFGVSYQNATRGSLTQPAKTGEYSGQWPAKLDLTLYLDSTGITAPGMYGLSGATSVFWAIQNPVKKQVDKFLKLCYDVQSSSHRPNFLNVSWGQISFDCCLESVSINYTVFDRGGDPLRAELTCSFTEHRGDKLTQRALNLQSPDITHMRVVRAGDTLPSMCKDVYGNASYYVKVAKANKLKNFRDLKPGQEVYFPPIAK